MTAVYKLTHLDVASILREIRIWHSPAKRAYLFIDCVDSVRFITENKQVVDRIGEMVRNTGAKIIIRQDQNKETGSTYYIIDLETESYEGY
ncbi:hypothetical protein M5X00_29855 [Paenibacillus alvei]|uniref:hypothetical protein n=1 Tax=Paenibacillus alvei TaxID=44250 RepID=UPI0002899A6C|nr:hypothetical protein [Paenibacillus alvei]EJW14539.1 hypothetical protein PAV_13c01580 [Paenibacillus alvei DSM 29]MCY9540004.1 hypothetical protein [Paenibacillus alvei]MCY9708350.1 hypothetical protein [Paenibacillus alvei]MCY9738079.1 hypothetical protein [Paenibacillus alvei]MCY9758427.1 hypothetical protein [Paenibacillus alvei]